MFVFAFQFVIYLFLVGFLAHEASHYITARFFGKKITFTFSWGKLFNMIPIPRYIWIMPEDLTAKQKCTVAANGFRGEFIVAMVLLLITNSYIPMIAAVIHFLLYPYYAGSNSDFNFITIELLK